jgi:hypothetical protein
MPPIKSRQRSYSDILLAADLLHLTLPSVPATTRQPNSCADHSRYCDNKGSHASYSIIPGQSWPNSERGEYESNDGSPPWTHREIEAARPGSKPPNHVLRFLVKYKDCEAQVSSVLEMRGMATTMRPARTVRGDCPIRKRKSTEWEEYFPLMLSIKAWTKLESAILSTRQNVHREENQGHSLSSWGARKRGLVSNPSRLCQ